MFRELHTYFLHKRDSVHKIREKMIYRSIKLLEDKASRIFSLIPSTNVNKLKKCLEGGGSKREHFSCSIFPRKSVGSEGRF